MPWMELSKKKPWMELLYSMLITHSPIRIHWSLHNEGFHAARTSNAGQQATAPAARAAASRVAREPRLRSSCDVLIAAFRCNITYQPPPSRSPRRSSILPFLRRARRGPRRWLRLGPEGDKQPRDVFKRVPAPDFYLQIPPNRIAIPPFRTVRSFLCGSDRQNENRRRHFCKVPLVVKFPSKQLRIWIAIKFLGRFQTSNQSCGSVIYIY